MSGLPVVYEKDEVIARKAHKCCECGKTIHKGEKYITDKGLWEGSGWSTFHTCDRCDDIRDEVYAAIEDISFGFGQLRDEIAEADLELKYPHFFSAKYLQRMQEVDK